MPYWLKMPHMTVGSDAMWATEDFDWDDDPAKYVGHPRTSGTHTKVLRMAREEKVPLMFTLAQLSYWSAHCTWEMPDWSRCRSAGGCRKAWWRTS